MNGCHRVMGDLFFLGPEQYLAREKPALPEEIVLFF